MKIKGIYDNIVKKLKKLQEKEPEREKRMEWFKKQHKRSGIASYGISTPSVQKLGIEEKFNLAILLYKSGNFEQSTVGDKLVELNFPLLTPSKFSLLDEVVEYFNNWASVDWMCLNGFQSLLLKYREKTLRLLGKWNRSHNLWKQRASVLIFVRKIGASGDFTDEVIKFCDNLIWDREELIQKAVGWALKNNIPGNRKRIIDYIKELRRKGVPSTITLYAIKDLKCRERKEILNVKSTD